MWFYFFDTWDLMCSEAAWASTFFRFVLIFVRWALIATFLFDSRNLPRPYVTFVILSFHWFMLATAKLLSFKWILCIGPGMYQKGNFWCDLSSWVVSRICLLGWNRVTVSENLDATAAVPIAHVITSLNYQLLIGATKVLSSCLEKCYFMLSKCKLKDTYLLSTKK